MELWIWKQCLDAPLRGANCEIDLAMDMEPWLSLRIGNSEMGLVMDVKHYLDSYNCGVAILKCFVRDT